MKMGRRTSIGRTKQNNAAYLLPEPPQDILDLYKKNPQGKKRKQNLIKALATQVESHKLVIWFVGTRGAGWSDIEKGYEGISDTKQKAIEAHVVFESKSASIMPRNRYEIQSFYSNLANLLRKITTGKERPDLICFCRGGGGQEDLYRLNNEELCRSIIECPVPVCAAVGHSTDKSLWIKQIADFATDTPSKFLMFLVEVLEQAGFLFHQESSGSQTKSYAQPEQPKPKSELPAATVSTPVYGNYNSNPRVIPPPTFSEGQTGSTGSGSALPTSSELYFSGKPRNSHPNIEKDSWVGFDTSSARKIAELRTSSQSKSDSDIGSLLFIGFCGLLVVCFFIFSISEDRFPNSTPTQIARSVPEQYKNTSNGLFDLYQPATSYSSSRTASGEDPAKTSQPRNGFSMPPKGSGMVLNTLQIAWCLKEKARIEVMEEEANALFSPKKTDHLNNLVDNYNSRCANFKYASADMDKAKQAVDQIRLDIKAEAIKEISRVDEANKDTNTTTYTFNDQKLRNEIKPLTSYEGNFANTSKAGPKTNSPVIEAHQVDSSIPVDLTDSRVVNRIQNALSKIYKWIPTKGSELAAMHYAAIHDFQERNGLTVSNHITQNLLQNLENDANRRQNQGTEKIFLDFDSPKYVMKTQALLQQAGYSVPYTGYIDPQTESAIRDFQSKNGVKLSGKVGPYLIQQLENKVHTFGEDDPIAAIIAKNKSNNFESRLNTFGGYSSSISSPDSSEVRLTTRRIQQALSNLYKWIPVKGELTAMHYAAIHDFQARHDMVPSNKITPELIEKIEWAGRDREYRGIDKTFLDFNSYSNVLRVQRLLWELGYQTPPSGYMDDDTESDIKDFQSKNGVKVTGKIGPFLIQKLEEKVEAQAERFERRTPGYRNSDSYRKLEIPES